MGDWHRRLIAETRALQGLAPTIADDPVGIELAARFLAVAIPAAPLVPAIEESAAGIGAAGPRDDSSSGGAGEGPACAATVGRSGGNRPAAPTTKKERPAATGRSLTTAG